MIQVADSAITYPFVIPAAYGSNDEVDASQAVQSIDRPFLAGKHESPTQSRWRLSNGKSTGGKLSRKSGAHTAVDRNAVRYGGQVLFNINPINKDKLIYTTGTVKFSVVKGYEQYPVVSITCCGAVMPCNWLTEMTMNPNEVVYSGIGTRWKLTDTKIDYSIPIPPDNSGGMGIHRTVAGHHPAYRSQSFQGVHCAKH